ncbi:MAG: glycosyltransferase family 39 protein [Proteobacteria bacterium]|nr:glycosyltransferase family 39 protein [Pseudomonadota bacterium]
MALIFFAAIALRVMFFALGPYGDGERAMYPDSYRYVELSEALVGQGAFARSGPETGVVHEPLAQLRQELGQIEPVDAGGFRSEIMRTPGYPALLGATVWLGLGLNGLLIVQCLFSAVSVVLVYGIGRVLLKRPGPALFAAAVVALHPADIIAPTAVLTETCFTLLMLLGLWSVADRETRGIGSTTFGGLMIGLSVLVRPVSIMLGPAVALPEAAVVLVNPGVALETAAVFRAYHEMGQADGDRPRPALEPAPEDARALALALEGTANDLTPAALTLAPAIADVLAAIGAAEGCRLARMTGSGATCFGLFDHGAAARAAAQSIGGAGRQWWCWAGPLAAPRQAALDPRP